MTTLCLNAKSQLARAAVAVFLTLMGLFASAPTVHAEGDSMAASGIRYVPGICWYVMVKVTGSGSANLIANGPFGVIKVQPINFATYGTRWTMVQTSGALPSWVTYVVADVRYTISDAVCR